MLYVTLIILIIALRAMVGMRNSRAHGAAVRNTRRVVLPHGGRKEYRARANALEGR